MNKNIIPKCFQKEYYCEPDQCEKCLLEAECSEQISITNQEIVAFEAITAMPPCFQKEYESENSLCLQEKIV